MQQALHHDEVEFEDGAAFMLLSERLEKILGVTPGDYAGAESIQVGLVEGKL